ncbi:MAG: M28 family peptidase [Leptolyngbyaceae bacterium]|nr:M28 family peptidase [Leptolyngbyaceae bacterium]
MTRLSRVVGFIMIACVAAILVWRSADLFPETQQPLRDRAWANAGSPEQAVVSQLEEHLSERHVDGDRLLRHVEALSVIRHSESERGQAKQYIMEQLQLAGWRPEAYEFSASITSDQGRGVNIVATQPDPASDIDPVTDSVTDSAPGAILLGAHYDTVAGSPGADDNASAVAVVLELARLLADVPTRHPLTIALFDLEETGLLGSTAFVETLGRSPNIEGAVILEMMGYACYEAGCQTYPSVLPVEPPSDTGNFLAVVGDLGHSFIVDAFRSSATALQDTDKVPDVYTLQVPTLGRLTPDLFRSDHVPFWRSGIGAVMVTDTANFRNPHYHQSSDRPDTLDMDFLTGSAGITLRAIAHLLS